jgi:hypothetical protein
LDAAFTGIPTSPHAGRMMDFWRVPPLPPLHPAVLWHGSHVTPLATFSSELYMWVRYGHLYVVVTPSTVDCCRSPTTGCGWCRHSKTPSTASQPLHAPTNGPYGLYCLPHAACGYLWHSVLCCLGGSAMAKLYVRGSNPTGCILPVTQHRLWCRHSKAPSAHITQPQNPHNGPADPYYPQAARGYLWRSVRRCLGGSASGKL